jgi:hypothetical protein
VEEEEEQNRVSKKKGRLKEGEDSYLRERLLDSSANN